MKGQLSAEMLVVIVVILGIAILLAGVMLESANKAKEKIESRTDDLLEKGESDFSAGFPPGNPSHPAF